MLQYPIIEYVIDHMQCCIYVTGYAKRGLIHASDFANLMRHNLICSLAMRLKFTVSLV